MCFFFNEAATTEIYTLSRHDALPICRRAAGGPTTRRAARVRRRRRPPPPPGPPSLPPQITVVGPGHDLASLEAVRRSEEHTSELQSRQYLVCRLLLEKNNRLMFFSSS